MNILLTEVQIEKLISIISENRDIDERSRSFAFTRKRRLFSKSEMMSNPDRYKPFDKKLKGLSEEPKENGEKWIKCKNCKKLFTQTIRKGKKSTPVCPHCGTYN